MIEILAKAWFEALGLIVSYSLVYLGVRDIFARNRVKMACVVTVIGLIFCVGMVFRDYASYSLASRALEVHKYRVFTKETAPHTWSAKLSGENREMLGYQFALEEFNKTGALTSYVDRNGRAVRFLPTQNDIRDRELYVSSRAELTVVAKERYIGMARKVFLSVFVVLLAVVVGQRLRLGAKCDGARSEDSPSSIFHL